MASSARKIDKKEWHHHKETILHLYFAPGGTLTSVADQMRERYGFNASLNQYEWQLNSWARKNLTGGAWREILARYDYAASQNLQARVIISGKPVSKEKLQRMRRRYKTSTPGRQPDPSQAHLNDTALSHVTIEILSSNGEWHEWRPKSTGGARHPLYSASIPVSIPRSGPTASPALIARNPSLNRGLATANVGLLIPPPLSQDIASTLRSHPSPVASVTELATGEPWALSLRTSDCPAPSITRNASALSPALVARSPTRSPHLTCGLSSENIGSPVALYSSRNIASPLPRSPSPFASAAGLAHGEPGALSPGTLDFLTAPGNDLGGMLDMPCDAWASREWYTDAQDSHSSNYTIAQNSSLVRSQNSSRARNFSFGETLLFNQLDDWPWSMTTLNLSSRETSTMSWYGMPSTAEHETPLSLLSHREKDNCISRLIPNAGILAQRIAGFFPSATADWRQSATMSPEDVLKVHSTRLLLLSVTNNFAGLEEFPARDIFKCLKNNGMLNAMLFYALKNNDGYRARALAEHLFRAAILAGDGEITHQLLETGHVSANSKLLFDGEEKESPIQAAAAVRSPAVVQVLLSAGADLHGESLDFWGSEPPKEWTLSHPNTYISHWAQNELLDITNTFLEAGVVPELSHVTRLHDLTGSTCEQRILDMLIPRLQPLEHWCCEGTHIIEIMSKLEESQVAMLVARLSSGPTTPDCQRCLHLLESLLLAAACIGMIEVFQSLLTKIISRSNPEFWGTLLSASIRGDNQAIINIALEQGYMTSKDASHLPDSLTEIYSCRREKDSCDQESHFTSPLAEAIRSKNSILVEKLEAAGALTRLNYHGHLGPAIRAAVAVRDLEYAKKILMHAPRAPEIGYSPELTGAIEEDREDLVQILLDAGAYLSCNEYSSTILDAITTALECRNAHIFYALLESANYGVSSLMNMSRCIRKAIAWGDDSVISALFSAVLPIPGPSSSRWLLGRSSWVTEKIISSTLYLGVLTKTQIDQYLVFAVHNNNLPVVRELVDAGAEPLKDDILALAVEYSPTALQYLLSKAPQRPYGRRCLGSTALYRAVELGSQAMESLDTLLAATIVDKKCMIRFGINQFQSPLGLAIMRSRKRGSDLSIVKKLLGAGCDANSIVKSDRLIRETALLAAIGTGNQDLVQFLTRHGADINKRMTLGIKRTPLQRAVETGSLDMVKWLIDNGADVNAAAARRGGGTALQLAAIGGSCNIVAELLGCGADMYAAPSQAHGSWPLEGAAEHGRLEILEYLWKAAGGFDKFHCQRAWEFAENNGHYACRDWLADKLASLPGESVMSI